MSLTQSRESGPSLSASKVTAETILQKKSKGEPITALTAYDYPTARLVDQAGIDVVLVGDSVGMAVLGYDTTLPVTMDEMVHHTRAVVRGVQRAFVVADMPFGSYQVSQEDALRNATRLVKEGGAQAVKIEGGHRRAILVEQLTHAEIPVVAHIGLTPQSVNRMGGYRVQGRSIETMESLYEDAAVLEAAGAVALVLEGIPREVAATITSQSGIPTIGIGAGPDCDGQILVFHDLAGLTFSPSAKFARRYVDGASLFQQAIERFRDDVTAHSFPNDEESYHLPRGVRETARELSKTL